MISFSKFNVKYIEMIPVKFSTTLIFSSGSFKCLNFATHNYLGFVGRRDIEEEAVKCIQKFGVGSCGPRAFYGKL